MALFARTPSYWHSRPLGCHETEYAEKFEERPPFKRMGTHVVFALQRIRTELRQRRGFMRCNSAREAKLNWKGGVQSGVQ